MTRAAAAAFLLGCAALTACQDNETAIARGDRLWADSSFNEALAEYRLAVSQRGDETALARLAHAHARAGALAEARDAYDRLLTTAPAYEDQAVFDYLYIMRQAMQRGDQYGVAAALDAALALRPELQLPDVIRPMARFQRERGFPDRALEYYRRALTTLPPDSAPDVLYELGLLNEDLERCATAIDYFRAFRVQAERSGPRRWRTLLGEARWHTGNCALQLARDAHEQGRASEALAHYEHVIDLGEPENLLDQAWFERGEILYGVGRFDEALEAYRMVLERNPARTGQLVERARERIDDIRFGGGRDGAGGGTPPRS